MKEDKEQRNIEIGAMLGLMSILPPRETAPEQGRDPENPEEKEKKDHGSKKEI